MAYSFQLIFSKYMRTNPLLDDISYVSSGNTTLIAKNKKFGDLYIHPTGKIISGKFHKVAGSHSSPILWTDNDVVIQFTNFPHNPTNVNSNQYQKQNNIKIINIVKHVESN